MGKNIKKYTFEKGNLEGLNVFIDYNYVKNVYPEGNTDVELVEAIKKDLPEGKTIFDVGSFIGLDSLVFAKMVEEEGRVVSFEPNIFNIERAKANFAANIELSKRIQLFTLALSDENNQGVMMLSDNIDDGFSSTSRLEGVHPKIRDDNLPEGFKQFPVEIQTLDNFVKIRGLIPNIIKVDIEGAEMKFLLGAKETICKRKPILYIEMHSEFCTFECTKFLISQGYEITILKEEMDNRILVKAAYSSSSLLASANNIKKENKKLLRELDKYESSISLKLTKPMRLLRKKLRV